MEMLGLYPTWYEPTLGSGWVLGVIAVIHVLASHTSVGAALVTTWLATVAVRRDRPELLEYVRRYGVFLLVFSYVLGSITGPGIWFSATVASPRGLGALIHTYVWYWATEWVFFVVEVVGIYLMVYLAGRVDRQSYLRIAWIFGLASWATLLVIVGILSFMLWPGQPAWFETGSSLDGFYGPYTFAQIASRTCFMLMAAALAGGLIASRIEDTAFRAEMIGKLSRLGIPAAVLGSVCFQWGLATLPESAHVLLKTRLPGYFVPTMWAILVAIVAYFACLLARPDWLRPSLAAGMMAGLLVFGIWPEERARESMRKPYVAGQFVYANQIVARAVPGLGVASELPRLQARGLLALHPFVPEPLRTVTPGNPLEAGQALALAYCSNCHGLGDSGPRPLAAMFGGVRDAGRIEDFLKGALATGNMINMPRIPLTAPEARALALFLAGLPVWQALNP
ncbi:hypothetical protein SAMN02949497_4523 [Methylomagnum ishizawai]|uniref:Cytochrome c domain-containing protein n=1 Tax=Methylomagnum ishizawai TaxID=1760988 RepID=A0A1Y6DA91_9GAMM|nr:cytochrome c [Methylomagnum ishizawai]SMF97104.1 hypothetical protein SAMN02949497_4523 [Methylomagnum ishizawai]